MRAVGARRDDTRHALAKSRLLRSGGRGLQRRALRDHALGGIRFRGIGFHPGDRVCARLNACGIGSRARWLLELLLRDAKSFRDRRVALEIADYDVDDNYFHVFPNQEHVVRLRARRSGISVVGTAHPLNARTVTRFALAD